MDLYVLQLLMEGVHARVALNGVEIVADESAASKTLGLRVNPYIVDGENRLAVALRLPPPPVPAPAPEAGDTQASASQILPAPAAGEANFTLRLIGGRFGTEPGPEGVLLKHEWDPARAPLAPRAWRLVFNETFRPPHTFGRWAWQDAPAVTPQGADAAVLRAAVAQLQAAAQARDARALLEAHRLKFAEFGRALDEPEDTFRNDLAEGLDAIFAARDFRVRSLDVDLLILEPLAEGRLVRVRRPDGGAPLQLSGGGEVLQILPVYTRLPSGWVIAR